ncbi:hypothetical protein ABFB50_06585 [Dehalococcoides sp. THU3]|uniref:hypothetical protein n=1 Tax=Dehalococcoides TaxID=61434 RepID=UPI003218AD94
METISIVSSIVSVIIGCFAIWLSVTFYRLSNKISEDTKEAAKGISASVDRLESLFDRLYSDTFSMMKDTVSDMRKHIWPDKTIQSDQIALIESKADEQIVTLKKQIRAELSDVIQHVGRTDQKFQAIEHRMTDLVERAIQQSRRVESEAQEELSMSSVIFKIKEFLLRYGEMPVGRIINHPIIRRRFSRDTIIEGLRLMHRINTISATGLLEDMETIISLQEPPEKTSKEQ